ncbi:DUF2306 domain-containing protein [Mucilaginibacter sp. HMF5004]|uniref:DUF2306 domain-containing protein n=1 Tax=Mucilaginibacter rivuli TaxID=2857527 RepID=UPI001C5CE18A|nr:DUF2306 domain-containing protein [Mucilaginibacter rivuli]MBW4889249.1 DUF2306 domain-containing protein [Mucilaginibacter rivuli]
MKFAGKLLRYFALLWILTLSLATLWDYLRLHPNTGYLHIKQFAVNTGYYLPFFYAHVIGSSVILLVGFFQFSKIVYSKRKLHRALGKIYILGVLLFAAPGAYLMTFFIQRGAGVFASFFIQNSLWVVSTFIAWRYATQGKIPQHVCMMRRSYGLAFAAVTLRFYIWLFTVLGNGVSFEHNYLIIAFLSWVPNLILVELINRYDKGNIYKPTTSQ